MSGLLPPLLMASGPGGQLAFRPGATPRPGSVGGGPAVRLGGVFSQARALSRIIEFVPAAGRRLSGRAAPGPGHAAREVLAAFGD